MQPYRKGQCMFEKYETPRLILDKSRLQNNAARVLRRAEEHNIFLRPHLKTSKSIDIAKIATGGRLSGVTVSTLKEAEYFASHGMVDILYAVGIVPNKFARVKSIIQDHGGDLILITDNLAVARAAVDFAVTEQCRMQFLVELDCGDHRGGIGVDDPVLLEIGRIFDQCPMIDFRGVMTHAGHSYATDNEAEVRSIAKIERQTVVEAARKLSVAGIASDIISVGSTPTFLLADNFDGLTEVRCGVFVFYDLAQYSRNVCTLDDIAISVLSTVIGHSHLGKSIILDAGVFALSKDFGANSFLSDAGYGYVCDPVTLERYGSLAVNDVHQEHGAVNIDDDVWFERLPVGCQVRILPNHACPTAAAHSNYLVVENGAIIGEWPRVNGW